MTHPPSPAMAPDRPRSRRSGRGRRVSESMLVDLREQLRVIAQPPRLPDDWDLQLATATAGGERFGGDLIVPALTDGGQRLEVVLVDVSGKGRTAGTRALMLAGAISGLLGVVPPPRLLPALNAHLLRVDWADGFATAAHLTIDLSTGAYLLATAGHPPPVHYHSGSGRWSTIETSGPLLGVFDDGHWPTQQGVLAPGDALLAYTDGAVEGRGHDVDLGLDRLLGHGERLVRNGFESAADTLLASATGLGHDDVSVALCRRRPQRPLLPYPR